MGSGWGGSAARWRAGGWFRRGWGETGSHRHPRGRERSRGVARRRRRASRLCWASACRQKVRLARRSKLAPSRQALAPACRLLESSAWAPQNLQPWSERSPCISCGALLEKILGGQAARMVRGWGGQCQAKVAGDRGRAANKARKQKDKKKTVIS